jgi:hypothetical protein
MTHENPESLVPGSMHVNRTGERVFIECVKLQSPWTDARKDPVHGVTEEDRGLRSYKLNGQYFENKQSEFDLIREYKEPQSYGGYLVVNIEGRLVTIRDTLDKALEDIRIWTKFSKEKYKIIRVSGTEEVEVPS